MTNETLRMQMLSGIITEGEYKTKLQENKKKKSLKESMIGGIVGVGAINQIPPRAKADYEMAFEHFLGERQSKIENPNQDLEEEMEKGEEEEESKGLIGKEPIPFEEWEGAIYDFITDNLTNDDEEIPMVVEILEKLVKALRNQ